MKPTNYSPPEAEECLKHNKLCIENIKELVEQRNMLNKSISILESQLKPPCRWCEYVGVYRCTACKQSNYEGYNIADYPSFTR